jgi:hypothetical protein
MSTQKLAQGLAGLGRNGDSVLVHMMPHEVQGLQALAEAKGGSLTINPETGLPEANFLGDIFGAVAPIGLGMLLGPAGLGLAESALGAGLMTGAAGFALSGGNLMKGISAGLGGYGGAGLGESLGKFGAINEIAPTELITNTPTLGADVSQFAKPWAAESLGGMQAVPQNMIETVGKSALDTTPVGMGGLGGGISDIANTSAVATPTTWGSIGTGAKEAIQHPIDFFKSGNGMQNALTLASPLMAIKPEPYKTPEDTSYQMKYEGPYTAQDRKPRTPTAEEMQQLQAQGSPEYSYFGDTNPYPGFNKAAGYAEGGVTALYNNVDGTPAQNQLNEPYGLGRLEQLSSGGMSSFAGGGPVSFDAGGYVPQVGGPSYAVAPTDLSVVAGLGQTAGQNSSSGGGLSALLGNAINDPMGRTANQGGNSYMGMGGQQNPNGGMNGKGMSAVGQQMYNQNPQVMSNPWMSAFFGINGSNSASATAPKALTMQDYIDSASRTYNPAASVATGTTPGAVERAQFSNINPQQPVLKAAGGGLSDGGFVVPADVVSHLGNGSTDAGLAALEKHRGARPIRGAGDGMSDSIATTIDGNHPARIANGEAYIPPEQVKRNGGASQLYSMMDKVRKARTGKVSQGKQINANKLLLA